MQFLRPLSAGLFAGWLATLFSISSYGQVTINEVMAENRTFANADGTISDWVELYNPGTEAVNLKSWSLTDSAANPQRWIFPNINLAAKGYLVIALDGARTPSSAAGGLLNAGFSLKATGDNLALYSPQVLLVDSLRFGPQVEDLTIGAIPSGSDLFVLTTPTPGSENILQLRGEPTSLRINEWMATPSSGADWFEVYNSSSLPVSLTGLYFADSNLAPSLAAPLSFIGSGGNGFVRFYADNSTNDNEVNFRLGASGDSIGIFTLAGTRINGVTFGQQIIDRSQGRLPDGSDNIQALNLATPAGSNLILYEGLRVNEILTHTDPPFEDAVEFHNTTAAPIDIAGWHLSNSRADLMKFKVPAGRIVPAQGYLVIYEHEFNGAGAAKPFTFNSAKGDRVVLAQAAAGGVLTGLIVEEEFEAAEQGISFGRHAVGSSSVFVPLESPTFGVNLPGSVAEFRTGTGASNAAPKIGPIVISEVMYNPSTNTATAGSTADPEEYIELANITGSPVALYDPQYPLNVWKIAQGVTFSFPGFSSIPERSSVLIVSFDPRVETSQLAAFRAKYSVAPSVPIYGPFIGKLDNNGEALALYRPDEPQQPPHPDAGLVPQIPVDRLDYLDKAPWPAEADGLGHSLQRKTLASFGNDPANWIAALPTAGQTPGGSELKITSISHSNGVATLVFGATPGRAYTIEQRSDLAAGSGWNFLASANAAGVSVTFSSPSTASQRFYRIVQAP